MFSDSILSGSLGFSMRRSHGFVWAILFALRALPVHGRIANTGAIAVAVSDAGARASHAAVVIESQATGEERAPSCRIPPRSF